MNKGIFALSICIGLLGCNEEPKVEDAIRAHLNDPDSAKFRNLVISEDSRLACMSWNSKNKMGGYGEWKFARLHMTNSGWAVESMEIASGECSEAALQSIKVGSVAREDALQKAIVLLQAAKGISKEIATEISHYPGGECGDLVFQYAANYSFIEEYKILGDARKVEGYSKNVKPLEDMLTQGDCSKDSSSLRRSLWPFARK